MRHYCTTCASEFDDGAAELAVDDSVFCVFCGTRIFARSVVPFSRDYAREEAFALGVINRTGPGFPDTLRQFRVPTPHAASDSLTPTTHSSPAPVVAARAPARRLSSLSASLAVGFGVGVALAFGAVALRTPAETSRAGSPNRVPVALLAAPARSAAVPAVAPSILATPPAAPGPRATSLPVRVVSAADERRWWLDRARAEQRQYHLDAAERSYRRVLTRAPHDSEALSGLGELELLRGALELADTRFKQALVANASYIPALVAAADIRWQSGRVEEARRAYREIVEQFEADSYPPYVAQRSAADATPACGMLPPP
jgi:DNA-directed RNA polymerase subunit RPC12/RpoP